MTMIDSLLLKVRKDNRSKDSCESASDDLHSPEEILDNICQMIKKTSQYEMARQAHDIIIKNVTYCNNGKDLDHSYLGPLMRRQGVCDGISQLYNQILTRLSIESTLAYGDLTSSTQSPGPHAWNLVKIDGKWFHIDVTADLGLSKSIYPFRYDYFCLSDKEICLDHKYSNIGHKCINSSYNYYVRCGFLINNVQQFDSLLISSISSKDKRMIVKLPSYLDFNEAYPKLNDRANELLKQRAFLQYSIRMEYNPDQKIIAYQFTVL